MNLIRTGGSESLGIVRQLARRREVKNGLGSPDLGASDGIQSLIHGAVAIDIAKDMKMIRVGGAAIASTVQDVHASHIRTSHDRMSNECANHMHMHHGRGRPILRRILIPNHIPRQQRRMQTRLRSLMPIK